MEFIHYTNIVDIARLNKKFVQREWWFMFDTILKVFTSKKTGCDQISDIAHKLAHSLAYENQLNMGKLIPK